MAFWATVVAVVLVLYVLSFGPYLWFHNQYSEPEWMERAAGVFFAPATWVYQPHLGPVSKGYRYYCWWWIEGGEVRDHDHDGI